MLKVLIIAFLAYLLYRPLKSFFSSGQKLHTSNKHMTIDEMVQDPLCKTYVPLVDARKSFINGREYFFCSKECADRYEEEMKK